MARFTPFMHTMKSIELFAGAGGLGIGLQRAGFAPLEVVEWDRWCCDTLRENSARHAADVSQWKVTEGDVRDVDFAQYENKLESHFRWPTMSALLTRWQTQGLQRRKGYVSRGHPSRTSVSAQGFCV